MTVMLVAQRHELLVGELERSGVLKVTELADRLRVSRATIRRDLMELEVEGRVTRVRGGALLATPRSAETGPPRDGATGPGPRPAGGPAGGLSLGLLVPSATYYYPRAVAGVRAVAAERNARVMIGLTDYAESREMERIAELAAAGAHGLLVTPSGDHLLPHGTLERLRGGGLPFVLMERQPANAYEACEFVASDHRQGAFAAVRHLAGLGHERVALFTNGSPTAALVAAGYAAAVETLALRPSVPVVDSGRPSLGTSEAARHYDAFLRDCLASGTRAALVHSDQDAIELLRRVRAAGLRTPEDLALIAYDDEIAALAEVPLTAVAPAKQQLGELAARLLLERLEAEDPAEVPVRQLLVQPRLIVRDSCGARMTAPAAD
ncbi:DNA-binding transcriptional regulator, LacI/PurR family [Streptomyces zhaozhouensis]|uniref:DNA-binding transcriptional regulator, LacI/PurR family n=1 Tax=Streptomyces zhaozhouensis TaxID=1300267 RepID=A0A286DZK1_9ACTN|nr:substrate-binding domain-containing protein [Streptomyces zhaozhouensis]SOD64081.1 DNA-binding transcriptional regulator, LacI/PurR family [Streptomyces zhaozhouensis]